MKHIFPFYVIFLLGFSLVSCVSAPKPPSGQAKRVSEEIGAPGVKTADQLYSFFVWHTGGEKAEKAKRLAVLYLAECAVEGINSDVAFAQMCLETGFLQFGNLVTEDMNNFCGLGAIDAQNRGLSFPSEQIGVRAHVQHLKAYGSTEPLILPLVDTRFRYVQPRGKAPTVRGLAGTWAADPLYGDKLVTLLSRLDSF